VQKHEEEVKGINKGPVAIGRSETP
jgi:hypothetical protein